jgi:tetratricopeptide (TPR) repeat protein
LFCFVFIDFGEAAQRRFMSFSTLKEKGNACYKQSRLFEKHTAGRNALLDAGKYYAQALQLLLLEEEAEASDDRPSTSTSSDCAAEVATLPRAPSTPEHEAALVSIYLNLSLVGLKLESWGTALRSADAVRALRPRDVKATYRRGQALLGLGRVAEARACMVEVLEIQPTNAVARRAIRDIDVRVQKERDASELARATEEGRQRRQRDAAALKALKAATPTPPAEEPSGAVRMQWTQTKKDAILRIFVPRAFVDDAATSAAPNAKIRCAIKRTSIAVMLGGVPVVEGKLHGPVVVDESTWTVDSAAPTSSSVAAIVEISLVKELRTGAAAATAAAAAAAGTSSSAASRRATSGPPGPTSGPPWPHIIEITGGGGAGRAGAASTGAAAPRAVNEKAAKVAGDLTGMVKEMFGADVDVDLRGSLASS